MSVAVVTFFLDIDSNGRCQPKAPMLLLPMLMMMRRKLIPS